MLLGTRKDESGSRQQLMSLYEIEGSRLSRHSKFAQTYVYTPLRDFITEDVWNYLLQSNNPPKVKIEFYENINNLSQITCFSNEGNRWRNSKISFQKENVLQIEINEKFVGERGRINCSLREKGNYWRWLGIQFVVSDK